MRKLGWYADRWDELAMNLGTWLAMFGIGYIAGFANTDVRMGVGVLIVGILLGVIGQLKWGWSERKRHAVVDDARGESDR